jgi:hypothetical protein
MTDVLTQTDKQRIQEEERFRSAIRKELSLSSDPLINKKKWYESAWAAVNSNFGIWFLSAVLLTGVGKVYTDHQNSVQEQAKKREGEQAEEWRTKEISDRLTLEISFRFSNVMSRLHATSIRFGETLDEKSQAAIVEALEPLVRPATDAVPPLFPEFKSYSGLALVAELRRHVVGPATKENLKDTLAKTSGLMYEVIGESNHKHRSARAVAGLLLERMRNPRWNNGFPYTDCSIETPFC